MKKLLTEAEKAFLQTVIKPYRKWVVSIEKHMVWDLGWTKPYLKIRFNHPKRLGFNLPILDLENSYQFNGLELDTKYDLKTLGL